MRDPLSARQLQILSAIREWITEYGEGPSVRQIGVLVGLSSTGSVAYQLAQLEQRGLISRSERRWRTVRLGS
ncbi:LexA family protein [Streptomyces scopuliridis]|uniref:LexA family protein n=1 Tax=Streptomyces scopuliridis TaxID=452529 RepID=UPI003679060F